MIITESKFKADTKWSTAQEGIFESYVDMFEFKDGHITALKKNKIFISYKHNEDQYVYRLKDLLKQYGFDGYIDKDDGSMPVETSGETAKKLKQSIASSKKFILIATNAAINSRWCNWKLGYADPHKYIDHLVLLCIKPDYAIYDGNKYLQIYPSVQVTSNSYYYVHYPNGQTKSLANWLKL